MYKWVADLVYQDLTTNNPEIRSEALRVDAYAHPREYESPEPSPSPSPHDPWLYYSDAYPPVDLDGEID